MSLAGTSLRIDNVRRGSIGTEGDDKGRASVASSPRSRLSPAYHPVSRWVGRVSAIVLPIHAASAGAVEESQAGPSYR